MSDDAQAALVAEQLARFRESLLAEMRQLETKLDHHIELDIEKHHRLDESQERHTKALDDHEIRLRANTDGVTTFKVWSGLASGGGLIGAIIALFKAFFVP